MTSLTHLAATCEHCPACPYFGRHPQPQQHTATTPQHSTGLLRSLTATRCNSSTLFLVGKETALILLPPLALSPPLLHFRNATSKDSFWMYKSKPRSVVGEAKQSHERVRSQHQPGPRAARGALGRAHKAHLLSQALCFQDIFVAVPTSQHGCACSQHCFLQALSV